MTSRAKTSAARISQRLSPTVSSMRCSEETRRLTLGRDFEESTYTKAVASYPPCDQAPVTVAHVGIICQREGLKARRAGVRNGAEAVACREAVDTGDDECV